VKVEKDELRDLIAANEDFSRDYWEHTTLTIRFTTGGGPEDVPEGVWRFEGVAPELLTSEKNETFASILTTLAGDGAPPPFELDWRSSIFSWGGDGSSLDVVLSVGMGVLPLAYPIIMDLLSRRASNAENRAWGTLDVDEADHLARWYLEAELTGRSEWEGPPEIADSFSRIGEAHEGHSHTFTYERDDSRYRVTVEHLAGSLLVKAWEQLPPSDH
jgi:hypothetical protein